MAPLKKCSSATSRLTVVMVGPTGQGKSTLGNLLAGGGAAYAPFTTSDDFDSETLEAAHADFMFDLQNFRAIDTIGFLDTRMDAQQNMDKFAGFADRAPGGIDVFLFVLKKGRFTEQSLAQISAFKAVAGENAMRHVLLVFTHCGNETNDSLQERCSATSNQHLRTAIESSAGVIGVDSLASERDDRPTVITAIKEVVKANCGQKYDNSTLQEARRRREELQQRIIRFLSQERREAMEDKLEGLFHGRFTYEQVHQAVEEAIEREERQRKEDEERMSLQALLAAAQSEAMAWKEVARNVLMAQSGGRSSGMLSGCCGPPMPATYDSGEVRFQEDGLSYGGLRQGTLPGGAALTAGAVATAGLARTSSRVSSRRPLSSI